MAELTKSILFVGLGLAGIILGSDLVVDSATNIASSLGVSERIISLTIVAFGTSLPELVTAVISAIKKEQDILVGNIIAMLFGCFSIGVFLVRLFVFGCTAVSVNIYAQPHNSKDRPNTKVYPFVGNFEVVEVYSHMINIVLTIIVIAMNEYSITMLSTWELIILAIALIIQLAVTISMVKRFYWQSIVLMEFYK